MTVAVTMTGRVFTEAVKVQALVIVRPAIVQAVPTMSVVQLLILKAGAVALSGEPTLYPGVWTPGARAALQCTVRTVGGTAARGELATYTTVTATPLGPVGAKHQSRTESLGG